MKQSLPITLLAEQPLEKASFQLQKNKKSTLFVEVDGKRLECDLSQLAHLNLPPLPSVLSLLNAMPKVIKGQVKNGRFEIDIEWLKQWWHNAAAMAQRDEIGQKRHGQYEREIIGWIHMQNNFSNEVGLQEILNSINPQMVMRGYLHHSMN